VSAVQVLPGSLVVGVDGSRGSDAALLWAVQRARLSGNPVALVHARGVESAATGRRVLTEAERDVRRLAPDLRLESVEHLGDPGNVLTDVPGAELVVIGSRGRGPVRSRVLGSVSDFVARHTDVPVIVVRPHQHGLVRRGVLVGADGTAESVPVLEFAYREASLHQWPLRVLHSAAEDTTPDEAGLTLAESLSGLSEKFPDVRTTCDVVHGPVVDRLVSASVLMHLLVVGRHRHTYRAVLDHASTAVAVVPE
jgi:nucleotide-binding universal stress UspA family protein